MLADQRAADRPPVDPNHGPIGLVAEGNLGDAGHQERIDQAGEDGENDGGECCADRVADHGKFTRPSKRSMSLMPMKGTMIPPRP